MIIDIIIKSIKINQLTFLSFAFFYFLKIECFFFLLSIRRMIIESYFLKIPIEYLPEHLLF
ncbi:Hypothetical protein ETEE_0931 [Edwardsiella anguillarum ET080813]|uniref:Uncharacterized protein n=1 Tax=Edwardsiella anguillarum ET080813 TaxID=667120 RepID=A0A076LKX8_9GAMM|nr:Hypothetical protein ETEE_0931 [Edwardsiella anguillarum ET080813]